MIMTPNTFTQPPPKPTTTGGNHETATDQTTQPESAQAAGSTTDQTEGNQNPHHTPDHHTETATAQPPETTAQHRSGGEHTPHQDQETTHNQPTQSHQPANTDSFYDSRPLRGQTRATSWNHHPATTHQQERGAESTAATAAYHQHSQQPSHEQWDWGYQEHQDSAAADYHQEWGEGTPAEATAEDATYYHHSQQPTHESWNWGDYGSKETTAAAERYQQRSRESPYERWQREYNERQRAEQQARQPTPAATTATAQQQEHTTEFGELGDGRPLRGQRAESQHTAETTQGTWYNHVRDHRQIGPRAWQRGEQPWPAPSPAPHHETDRTDLMQRGSPSRATSSTDPPAFPGELKQALLTQLQLLRDTAVTIEGGDVLTTMVDVAAQLVHTSSHVSGAGTRKRGRKRPFTEPNALAEIATYANRAGGRTVPLPAHDMVEDLFFLIAELEAGGLQLHEPLPGTVQRWTKSRKQCAAYSIANTSWDPPATKACGGTLRGTHPDFWGRSSTWSSREQSWQTSEKKLS